MNLLLSILALQLAFSPIASALEVQTSTGVYYFTSSQDKISAAQSESAEENQVFFSRKAPRALALEFAREELAKGNVCLSQAAQDLRLAQRSKLVSRMCRDIFRDDISKAQAIARRRKWTADSIRCEASVEALETPGNMKVVLAFRSSIVMRERLPAKLARAGFSQ